ncbi:MAG: N-acetylmuramoyl-L-alanine amidase [Fimbriimonadaceae bacterium]|nr:N-acetylmuramoyl-L-alanine amidase [Chitinophagales bacterium]
MHYSTKIAAILLVFFCTSFQNIQPVTENNSPGYKLKTVVIDAGHGGHDHGCSGSKSKEKNVALSISLKLGALIEKNFPDVKVIYTRKTDIFLELHERAAVANKANADLFICIHCNANPSSSPYGTETYVMGLHKTAANLGVAQRENDVILLEDNYEQHYDGFDPNDAASHIMFSLFQHAYMDQSILFAAKCEEQFKKTGRHSRGVKQAGFLVLWKTGMPSVLIETGFLTNVKDEKFLASEDGQINMSENIYRAFKEYKYEMENAGGKVDAKKIEEAEKQMNKEEQIISENNQKEEFVNGLEFYVQYYASEIELKISDKKFTSLKNENISYVKDNKWYKYRTGPYSTLDIATQKQSSVRKAGYKDAFVIAYQNGKKIPVDEARLLQPK